MLRKITMRQYDVLTDENITNKNTNKNTNNKNNNNNNNNNITNNKSVDFYLNQSFSYKKSNIKISDDMFCVPIECEYDKLQELNYSLCQLKKIAKYYKIRFNTNKYELRKILYNFLFFSHHANIIQKNIRRMIIKNYIYLHGPGFNNKTICANDADFCTLDNLSEIPYTQFFSFKDCENFVYGFDIQSIYNLYLKGKGKIENPFTTKLISNEVFINMILFIKYSNILNLTINIDYDDFEKLSKSKQIEMRILSVFQNMDSLGNYTNTEWFNSLNKVQLVKFYKELLDIWNYRANLSPEVKRDICPPSGNPFRLFNLNDKTIMNYNFHLIKKNILGVIEEFVNKGLNHDSKVLGSYYVLSALTLVNSQAADALPWLYESVNYT